MTSRYRCALDGIELGEIDESLIITDIAYDAPARSISTAENGRYDGARVTRVRTVSQSVTISFEIHERDTRRRMEVCSAAQAWAMRGGYLTTGDRPGQRLFVLCDTPPMIASALRWTDRIRMRLVSYALPFWEDELPTRCALNGTSGEKTVFAPGFAADPFVEAQVKNTGGGVVNALTLRAGDTKLVFGALGLQSGGTLSVAYEAGHVLSIRVGGETAYHRRLLQSDDDLRMKVGKRNGLSFEAGGTVNVTYTFRGLYV